jgi:hypothetical protein
MLMRYEAPCWQPGQPEVGGRRIAYCEAEMHVRVRPGRELLTAWPDDDAGTEI